MASCAPAVLLALLPKCPLCLAAYGSVFGVGVVIAADEYSTIRGAMIAAVLAVLVLAAWGSRRSGERLFLAGATVAGVVLVVSKLDDAFAGMTVPALAAFVVFVALQGARVLRRSRPAVLDLK